MKVILTEEIRGLGTRGDVVNVKDGYARNFLLPKNLAREATPGNLKSVEQERKKWAVLAQQEKVDAQKAADAVKGVKVTIAKRVGENNQLFGSVTANEIADALEEKGVKVEKRRIELAHSIKTVGTHEVDVRLHREVTAHIQVEVVPIGVEKLEEEEAPAAQPQP
jgi:large subunit ribosomal protein L9